MENWLGGLEFESGTRKRFLIKGDHVTMSEFYRVKEIFEEIAAVMASVQSLLGKLKTTRVRHHIRNRIAEEISYLLVFDQFLEDVIGTKKGLENWFIFDIVKTKKKILEILEIANDLSGEYITLHKPEYVQFLAAHSLNIEIG